MRTAASLLAIMLLTSGCQTTTTTATNGAGSNSQLVRSLYDAFARGDVPTILGAMDQGVVWNEAEGHPYVDRNPYRGPQGVADGVFQRIGTEWTNYQALPQQFIEEGDTVVVLGRYKGTYKSSGTAVDAQFAHVWTVRNGKIIAFQQYTDTDQFQRAMKL